MPGGAFDIIAQKGDISYQQIYKVVLQEHVKTYYERAELTNMEEDIGLIGLRRSKTRYRPEYMLKKIYSFLQISNYYTKDRDSIYPCLNFVYIGKS